MSLSKQYEMDAEKENNGVAFIVGTNADGSNATLYIARQASSNKAYQKGLEKLTRDYRRQIEMKTLAEEQAQPLFLQLFCATQITGWDNVPLSDVTGNDGEDGRPLDEGYASFTEQNARALFNRLPELYKEAQAFSLDRENYRKTRLEVEAKN